MEKVAVWVGFRDLEEKKTPTPPSYMHYTITILILYLDKLARVNPY